MPEISIIVPVYNVEQYLPRCIESILNQTYKDFELILVNDGSTDNSGNICDEFAKKDKRIAVYHQKNGGVSKARNIGLSKSNGTYIMFCDSDDYVDLNWCECLYKLINNDNVDLGLCGYSFVYNDSSNAKDKVIYSNTEYQIYKRNEFFNLYLSNLINMPWNKIYKKDIILRFHLEFNEAMNYNEDLLFVMKYIQSMKGDFGICNKALNFYVKEIEDSLTNRYIDNYWKNKQVVLKELRKTSDSCNINFTDIEIQYYDKCIWAITFGINNNMLKTSKLSLKDKIIENKKMLDSDFCNVSFARGTFDTFNPVYKRILKTKSVLPIMVFNMLYKFLSK
ncbi:MAG: glycosyltransferase [Clostridium sp.]|nr:glycosyltransferase [Clostridium sp.]